MQDSSVLMLCPTFNSYSSIRFAEIADKVSQEFVHEREDFGLEAMKEAPLDRNHSKKDEENQKQNEKEVETYNNDFEFAFSCNDHESLTISADEIFSNGQIRPIFNRKLGDGPSPRRPLRKLLSEEGDSMPPESDTLAGTYCIWKPKEQEASSPERYKKSNSTGTSKRWRLRDLISRSNSDGKEMIVFLARSVGATCLKKKGEEKVETKPKRNSGGSGKATPKTKNRGSGGEGVKSAVEIHYMRNRALKEEDRRRTYLPYRRDIVGFFANVNGLSRNLHPF